MLHEVQPPADDVETLAAGLTAEQRRLVTDALLHLARLHRGHAR